MKSLRVLLRLILLVACGVSSCPCFAEFKLVPYDAQVMHFPVTPEQATQIARQWAGNSTLPLELQGVDRDTTLFQAAWYVLQSPDRQEFRVDCYTGQVGWWKNLPVLEAYGERKKQDKISPLPQIPQNEADEIALTFVRAHFPNFDALGLQKVASRPGSASFAMPIPGGGWFSGNQCGLVLDKFTGDVCEYVATCTGSLTVPVQPSLTPAQAEALALNSYAGDPDVATAFTYAPSELHVVLDSLGQQRLVWTVSTATSQDATLTLARWEANAYVGAAAADVYVDAFTGEVILHMRYLGGGEKKEDGARKGWRSKVVRLRRPVKPQPGSLDRPESGASPTRVLVDGQEIPNVYYAPITRNGVVYWYAGYLKSPLWRMRLKRNGATITVSGPEGERAVFRSRSRSISINGVTSQASHPPLEIHGRTYLTLSTWEQITGSRFEWSKSERTLQISLKPASKKPSAGGSLKERRTMGPATLVALSAAFVALGLLVGKRKHRLRRIALREPNK
jgi:hypothetical protein